MSQYEPTSNPKIFFKDGELYLLVGVVNQDSGTRGSRTVYTETREFIRYASATTSDFTNDYEKRRD